MIQITKYYTFPTCKEKHEFGMNKHRKAVIFIKKTNKFAVL